MTNLCKIDGCDKVNYGLGFCHKHYQRFRTHGDPNKLGKASSRKINFEIDENNCFNCTSHTTNSKGYPIIHCNNQCFTMGRFIYTEMFGEIPEGHLIRHTCDNRKCINPEHLITGTPQENSSDMLERDRSARGSRHKFAKLTEDQVLEIKNLLKDKKLLHREIASIYSVASSVISNINRGKAWKHVKL